MSFISSSMFRHNSPPRGGGDRVGPGGIATTQQQSALFQRLIILHDGLMPPPPPSPSPPPKSSSSSRGGEGRHCRRRRRPGEDPGTILGEDATLEERGEFVLYYHDRSHLPAVVDGEDQPQLPPRRPSLGSYSSGEEDRVVQSRHATEEAVRFANLCRALRSLPRTLVPRRLRDDDDDEDDDASGGGASDHRPDGTEGGSSSSSPDEEAEVVHLGTSILVYVPLEVGGDVYAVAQVPRLPRRDGSMFGGMADPRSVRDAVLRFHAEFALLRGGGGVHRSLLRTRRLEGTRDWSIEKATVATAEGDDGNDCDDDDDGDGRSSIVGLERLRITDDARWEAPVKSSADLRMARGGHREPPRTSINKNWDVGEVVDGLNILHDLGDSKKFPRCNPQGSSGRADAGTTSLHRCGGRSFPEGGSGQLRRKMSTSRVGRHRGGGGGGGGDGDGDCDGDDDVGDHVGYYRYGGMEELFALRRERRDLLTTNGPQQRRWSSGSDPDELFREVANDLGFADCDRRLENCDRRLETLLKILPITALREALAGHYDDRLHRIQVACDATGGGAGRRSVESVPIPIARRGRGGRASLEPVAVQHPPSAPAPFVCLVASEFMKSTMRDAASKFMFRGKLFGLSFICRDRLVLTEVVPRGDDNDHGSIRQQRGGLVSEEDEAKLLRDVTCMIVEHFRSFRGKIDADNDKNGDDMPSSRWRLGGAWKSDSAAQNGFSPSDGKGKYASNGNDEFGFVTYPSPPSNENSPINSLFVRSMKKHVWLQRVYLPRLNAIDIDDEVETLVAMFERGEFAFLLFFEQPSSHESKSALALMAEELNPKTRTDGMSKPISSATQAFVDVLENLAKSMTEFCKTYSPHVGDSVSADTALVRENDSKNIFYGEPGMNIISIDRNENSFVLLKQHDQPSGQCKRYTPMNNGTASPTPSKPILRLFGIGPKPKDTVDGKSLSIPASYSNTLDCRHELATNLPLDVTLALDDVFNEIGCITCRDNTMTSSLMGGTDLSRVYNDTGVSKSIELCTFLPQGWVYGRASVGLELYIILDTSKFVTINDVQKAVTRIRERIFNDKIR